MKKNIYIITLLIVIIDQFIKNVIIHNLALHQTLTVIPNFFTITYVENTGAAWSILENSTFLLTIISAICILVFNQYLMKKKEYTKLEVFYFGAIMGGILGNFIDRVVHNCVIDFLSFKFGNYYFPVFNIADMAIVGGILLLIFEMIRGKNSDFRSRERQPKN